MTTDTVPPPIVEMSYERLLPLVQIMLALMMLTAIVLTVIAATRKFRGATGPEADPHVPAAMGCSLALALVIMQAVRMNAATAANWTLWGLVITSLVAAIVAGAGSLRSYGPCHTPKWVDLTFLGSVVVGLLAIAVWVIA